MWKPRVNPQKLVFSFQTGLQTSHEKTQRKRQCTFLSERRQCEKAARCVVPTLGPSGTGKSHGDGKKIRGWWGEGIDRQSTEEFRAGKYSELQGWLRNTCIEPGPKPTECAAPG